jgi:hypothetical protein
MKILAGTITLGSASVSTYDTLGGEITVARTGAGVYTITHASTYKALVSAHVSVMAASAADLVPQLVSYSSKVLTIRTVAVATETDGASGVKIHFTLVLSEAVA